MFILNEKEFGEFDLKKARQFIEFWNEKYLPVKVKVFGNDKNIDYLMELNLDNGLNRLTEENVKRLLRWKDPYRLTEEISSGPNERRKKN